MLKSLYLKNFQSHKETALEFAPGVNVIIGASDSGKTAIFRAFRWLMYNRPLGDSFRSHWGGDTSVEIVTEEGALLTRWRTDDAHGYSLDGEKLVAVKTDVPEEVSQALRMSEINFQQQFDRPFLLDESPGQVASHYNRITNLESIDRTLQTLLREEKTLKKSLQESSKALKEYSHQLEEWAWIDEVEESLNKAEEENRRRDILDVSRHALRTVVGEYTDALSEEKRILPWLSLEEPLQAVLEKIKERDTLKKEADQLGDTLDDLYDASRASQIRQKLDNMERSTVKAIEADKERSRLHDLQKRLYAIVQELEKTEIALTEATEELKRLETDYAQRFPEVCPFCGSTSRRKKA